MIKNKTKENKGFTLAELLIVVAIIAVLVAIAVPVFNAQLEKSREATDAANIRAAYAEAKAEWLQSNGDVSKDTSKAKSTGSWSTTIDWPKDITVPDTVTQGTKFTVSITSGGTASVTQ